MNRITKIMSKFKSRIVKVDEHIAEVKIQPAQALQIAEHYFTEHGSEIHDNIQNKKPRISIIKKGSWYYIKRTNYPAMHIGYYMKKCIKVHVNTAKVVYD